MNNGIAQLVLPLTRNGIVRDVQNASESPYHLVEVTRTSIMLQTVVTELTQ